ncbi:hypothetical protein PG984_014062 [Apiospora sp. TS-2023a]
MNYTANKAKLLARLPEVPAIKSLRVEAQGSSGTSLIVALVGKSTPCAWYKNLTLPMGQEEFHDLEISSDLDGQTATSDSKTVAKYRESSDNLTRNVHQISLGTRNLILTPSTGVGIGILGADLIGGEITTTTWESLELKFRSLALMAVAGPCLGGRNYCSPEDAEATSDATAFFLENRSQI